MTRPYVLIDRDSWRPYFNPVFFCGVALALSTPGARVVRDLASTSFLTSLPIFFYAYVLFMGLLGLGLGVTSAKRGEKGARMIVWLILRILLGDLLCLPYLVFARALFPGRDGAFALIVLLTTLISLFFATFSRLVEEPPRGRSPAAFLTKYVVYLGYNAIPLAWIPLLSPLGAVRLLLDGAAPLQALLAFAVPAALLVVVLLIAVRLPGVRSCSA